MILRLLTASALALAVVTTPAFAAKGTKGKGGAKSGRALAHFDRDHNGIVDGEEVARMQAAYASLAALDTDHNGQLSDAEIAAAKIPMGKKGGKAAKKDSATATPSASSSTTPAKPQ
jgi:hypothetical protein